MRAFILSLGLVSLAGCSSLRHRTVVVESDPPRAAATKHVSVVYLTSGQVSFGDVSTKPEEPAQGWDIAATIEKAVRETLASQSKTVDSFRVVTLAKGQTLEFPADPKSEALIVIGENEFAQQDCYYSGIGILMDKRKRLFQTLIQPFAMLDVAVKFKDGGKILRAYNSRNVGRYGGATAASVEGVGFHDRLSQFPPDERAKLKNALQARTTVVVNALLSDLGFGAAVE